MKRLTIGLAAVGAGLLLAACSADKLTRPNLNSPTPESAATDPLGSLNQLAGGIIAQVRDQAAGWVVSTGILGREAFNYTATEGRNTTGFLVNPDDYTSFGGGALYGGRYTSLRNLFLFNGLVETASIPTQQKEAARGFSKTIEGLELHYIALRNDQLGAPVTVYEKPDSVAPVVSRDSVYNHVIGRLNEGATNLRAGGTSFPFSLGTGFAGFNTPATFLRFNRALAARVLTIRGSIAAPGSAAATASYQAALTALGESFLSPTGSLTEGVYNVFSTAAGSTTNGATSFGGQGRVVVAHPSITAAAPRQANGTPDARLTAKTVALATPVNPSFCATTNCIATSVGFTRYPEQSSPIPIIRNEELILLRAEARYFTGNVAGALEDINTIRTRSGGLAPITAADIATRDQFVTELLLQRRFSLLFEGHRWVDVRRFGRLNTLPIDRPNNKVVPNLPTPQGECLSRARVGPAALQGTGCPEATQ
jgi:hypothetical protein